MGQLVDDFGHLKPPGGCCVLCPPGTQPLFTAADPQLRSSGDHVTLISGQNMFSPQRLDPPHLEPPK